MLDCKTDIVVGKWRLRAIHQEREMLATRRLDDIEVRVALQQIDGLEVKLVDGVDLTGHHGVGTGRHVVDDDHFNRIDPCRIWLPVAFIARETRTHAWLETLENERSGANRLVEIGPALRNHEEVVVRQDVRQISIAAIQRNLDCASVNLDDIGEF